MSRSTMVLALIVSLATLAVPALAGAPSEPGVDLLGVGAAGPQAGTILAVAQPAAAAPASAPRATPAKSPQAEAVTMLARIIAAEAGGDYYSPIATKMAVGGAVVNHLRKGYGVRTVTANDLKVLLRSEPNYLSSLHDGNRYLFGKNASWLKANGFADCLAAARRVLAGEDPSHGGTNWYDTSIGQPYSSSKIAITARHSTADHAIVFYRFR